MQEVKHEVAGDIESCREAAECSRAEVNREIDHEQTALPKSERELLEEEIEKVMQWKYCDPTTTFAARLPMMIRQCVIFQEAKKTWAPAKPCCLANGFIEPPGPPLRDGQSCYHRLTKEQRRTFRDWVENVEAKRLIKRTPYNKNFALHYCILSA